MASVHLVDHTVRNVTTIITVKVVTQALFLAMAHAPKPVVPTAFTVGITMVRVIFVHLDIF